MYQYEDILQKYEDHMLLSTDYPKFEAETDRISAKTQEKERKKIKQSNSMSEKP